MSSRYVPKKMSHDPHELIELPYITDAMRRYVPKGMLGKFTQADKKKVRQILNLRCFQEFPRCRGKVKKFIKAREAEGDFTHSDKNHLCDECRCDQVAGAWTKGNFYGLGVQTGMYGVGYCERCIRSWNYSPGMLVKHARVMVREMQAYGTAEDHMDSEVGLKIAKKEASLVRQKEKVREDMVLLVDYLRDFRKKCLIEDGDPGEFTEMTGDGPMPAADKTKAELAIKFALAISKLNMADFKMNEEDFVNVEEFQKRMPQMLEFIHQCLVRTEEMVMAKHVRAEDIETTRPIVDYVDDIVIEGMQRIWMEEDMKRGRK